MFKNLFFLFLISIISSFAAQAGSTVSIPSGSGKVTFEALGHPSALRIRGATADFAGNFTTDATGVTGVVTVPLETLDSGIQLRDKHMKEKSLEVGKFPKAEFHLSKIGNLKEGARIAPGEYDFSGDLLLHGVKKTVSGKLVCTKEGDGTYTYQASFDVSLKEFEIPVASWMGITINDIVKITVQGKAAPKSEIL